MNEMNSALTVLVIVYDTLRSLLSLLRYMRSFVRKEVYLQKKHSICITNEKINFFENTVIISFGML